jgi:multiple sugar transport system substrate-binding protein
MAVDKISRRRFVLASASAGVAAGATLTTASAGPGARSARYHAPAIIGQAKTPITWAIPGNPDEVAVYEGLAQTFMEENPDIEVTTDREGSDFEKFVTMIAGGTPPDVGFATLYNWPSFAERNIFLPLDDFIEQDSYDLDDFYEQIITPYRYNGEVFGEGELYGLPKEIAIRAMYYNKDIFEEAGVELPTADEPWDWDRFIEMTEATTKEEGGRIRQYGYIQDVRWTFWQIWAWSAGGSPVDDLYNPTTSTLDDPAVLEGYQVFTDFVTKLKTAPSAAVTADQGHAEMFAAGLGASYNNGRWMVPLFRESDFAWDVMPMPMKTERAQTLSGSMFGICDGTENPDAAWKLLSYVVGEEGQTRMTGTGLLLPSRKSVAESDLFLNSTPPENNQIFLDELEFAKPLPLTPIYPELEKVINDQTDLVLSGEKSAADAIAEMHAQFNTLLQDA